MAGWVAVGLARDLGPGQVMASVLGDVELAVWRSGSGRLAAWRDRCPHRGMRLSHGFVRGETLACIYHGWVYGSDGGCRRIPAHPGLVPPAAIRAEGFAVCEADGVIWVGQAGVEGEPFALDGWTALRSMPFDCGVERLGFVAVAEGVLMGDGMCLLVQERAGGCMVHALTQGDAVAGSRQLEALRWRVEA